MRMVRVFCACLAFFCTTSAFAGTIVTGDDKGAPSGSVRVFNSLAAAEACVKAKYNHGLSYDVLSFVVPSGTRAAARGHHRDFIHVIITDGQYRGRHGYVTTKGYSESK